jgi:hypothetical protein
MQEVLHSEVLGSEILGSAQPLAAEAASLIGQETNEHRTLNVQHRIMNSVNLKKD